MRVELGGVGDVSASEHVKFPRPRAFETWECCGPPNSRSFPPLGALECRVSAGPQAGVWRAHVYGVLKAQVGTPERAMCNARAARPLQNCAFAGVWVYRLTKRRAVCYTSSPTPHRTFHKARRGRKETMTEFEPMGQREGDLPVLRNTTGEGLLKSKPGWKTVEAHMALLFTVVAAVAALLGYRNVTPEKLQNVYELIMGLVTTLGPLGVAGGVVWNLITSRGKFESNKVNATAAISMAQQGASGVGLLGGAFKKPGTWIDLARGVGASGAIPGKAGEVVGSILDMTAPRRTRARAIDERSEFDDATLGQVLEALNRRLQEVEKGQNDPDSSRAMLAGDVRAIMAALGMHRQPGDRPDTTEWYIVPGESVLADPSRVARFKSRMDSPLNLTNKL